MSEFVVFGSDGSFFAGRRQYQTKNSRLAELDRMSMDYYDRPFVELDADQRKELEDELEDQ